MMIEIRDTDNATEWVDDLFNGAIRAGISDLQLRLQRQKSILTVRARVNRVMADIAVADGQLALEVTNRIKVAAVGQSGPTRVILDGLYQHSVGAEERDLRVAVFPTVDGETIAIRLPSMREMPQLRDIEFTLANQYRVAHLLGMANGLLLMAGPVGSGKTTTMYALLHHLGDGGDKNVFAVEDPVEHVIPGVTQVPIDEATGNDWPRVLRGLRRSDLEVLMIGEVRGAEQARAALEIGNAGAKVISSIHANDSVGAVEMLLELSHSHPRTLGNQLRGVISQRLLRLLHQNCSGAGCDGCDSSGYKGLTTVHEVLILDDAFVEALISGQSAGQLRETAKRSGMQTLWDNAHALIAAGRTDHREAVRVLGNDPATAQLSATAPRIEDAA